MNIKFRLAEEGEMEEGGATTRGPTLEFVLEKGEMVLEEVEELRGGEGPSQQQEEEQRCTAAPGGGSTEPRSDTQTSSQNLHPNSGPDTDP